MDIRAGLAASAVTRECPTAGTATHAIAGTLAAHTAKFTGPKDKNNSTFKSTH